MNTVQVEWESFRRAMDPDVSIEQVQEMKIAFYGGAASVLTLLSGISQCNVSLDAGAHVLEGLWDECRHFAESL